MQENLDEFEKERTYIKIFDDILDDPELNVYDAYLYGVIYSFNSRGRECCYSQGKLAQRLGKSRKYINERLNILESKGWLQISEFIPGAIKRYRIT